MTTFHCVICNQDKPGNPSGSFTPGYGLDADNGKVCYSCCADRDRASMIETGRATLYLCADKIAPEGNDGSGFAANGSRYYLRNWPGSLSFPVGFMRKGRHNIARTRYDAWFHGPDGANWHAVQYGENTQIAHCRRKA